MRYLIAVLCALAVVITQVLYGGAMRPVFALPGLFLVGVAGALGIVAVFWRNVPAPSVACILSALALAGWLIWREVGSSETWLAGIYMRLTLACLTIYLVFACAITNPFHRLAFVCVLLGAALVQSCAAAWQFARPETGPLLPWMSEQLRLWYAPKWNLRGHGTYLNGNHLVWFLNVSGVFALSFTCWGRWGLKVKILCLYVALACFGGALVTLSRGGLLSMGVGIAVFLLLSAVALAIGARDRRVVGLLVVGAALLITTSVGLLVFKSSIIMQQRFDELVADSYRPFVFEAVLRQAQLVPLHGTGPGTFLYYGRQYRELLTFSDDIYAHNDWMQITADFGLPAFVLMFLVVWTHGVAGFRGLRNVLHKRMAVHSRPQSHAAALGIGALASLAIFATHSLFDFNMQIPANALLAAACVGILANPGMAEERGQLSKTLFRGAGCAVAAGCSMWLMFLICCVSASEFFWLRAENAFLQRRSNESLVLARAGLRNGSHARLERLLGEIYLGAALRLGEAPSRNVALRQAQRHLAAAREAAPFDGRTLVLIAEAFRLEGRSKLASAALFEAIRLSPNQGRNYERLGEFLEEDGRLAEARQLYLIASEMPDSSREAYKRAEALRRKLHILNR